MSGLDHVVNLNRLRRAFEAGEGEALLQAVHYCINIARIAPPAWVADAWGPRFAAWSSYESATLDAAFGVERTHLRAKRKNLLAGLVWEYVEGRRKREGKRRRYGAGTGAPLDEQLFQEAAEYANQHSPEALHINRKKARDLYYAMMQAAQPAKKI